MAFVISTTGTPAAVVFQDLGGRTFVHPVVDFDLMSEFSAAELAESGSVAAALSGGQITVKDAVGGNPITNADDAGHYLDAEAVAAAKGAAGTAVGDLVQVVDVGAGTPGLPALNASQLTGVPPGTPAASVVSETAFGQAPVVGVATAFAREDHQHGSPTDPVPAHTALPAAHHARYADAEAITALVPHTGSSANPHAVSAAQAGAEPVGSIATHTALPAAHHTRYADGEALTALAPHTGSSANPHAVSAAQAGAEPAGAIASHAGLPAAHHTNANDPIAGEKAALAGSTGTPGAGNRYLTAIEKAAASGLASLDASTQLPLAQLAPTLLQAANFQVARRTTFQINSTTTLASYLQLVTPIVPAGNYLIAWYYIWSHNAPADDFISELTLDGATQIIDPGGDGQHQQEAKDAAGTGDGGTNQRYPAAGFDVIPLTNAAHTFDLFFRTSVATVNSTLHTAVLALIRVP